MIENVSNKIQVQKLYTKEFKNVNFYLEYDPFYIAHDISVTIENDNYYTVKFNFRNEDYYIETCNYKLWENEDLLIDFTTNCIIEHEEKRIEDIKNKCKGAY